MNTPVVKNFSKLLLSDKHMQIKLLGDSITHGEGGTGFCQNGEKITQKYARNPHGHCWANRFKEFLETQFDCTVVNNACTGTNLEFILDNFEMLTDAQDDITLCAIGTNNRHQYFKDGPRRSRKEQMERVYASILALNKKFEESGKSFCFISNIPASVANEQDGETYWRILHMNDIHNLYVKASIECGFPLIQLYPQFLKYCDLKNINPESLLADGVHPNDTGHDIIYKLMLNEIGLA